MESKGQIWYRKTDKAHAHLKKREKETETHSMQKTQNKTKDT